MCIRKCTHYVNDHRLLCLLYVDFNYSISFIFIYSILVNLQYENIHVLKLFLLMYKILNQFSKVIFFI